MLALVFVFREANRLEEQQLHYRDNLQQQLNERASSAVANILLALKEMQDSLIQGLSALPVEDQPQVLQSFQESQPLVRNAFLWNPQQGFWFPEPRTTIAGLSPLPWTQPAGVQELPGTTLAANIQLSTQSSPDRLVNKQLTARHNLRNLTRSYTYGVQISTDPQLPAAIREDTIRFPDSNRPSTAEQRSPDLAPTAIPPFSDSSILDETASPKTEAKPTKGTSYQATPSSASNEADGATANSPASKDNETTTPATAPTPDGKSTQDQTSTHAAAQNPEQASPPQDVSTDPTPPQPPTAQSDANQSNQSHKSLEHTSGTSSDGTITGPDNNTAPDNGDFTLEPQSTATSQTRASYMNSGWTWTSPSHEARWFGWVEYLNRQVAMIEIDTQQVMVSLQSFVPESSVAHGQFTLNHSSSHPRRPLLSTDTLLSGNIPLGPDFPGWQLSYQTTLSQASLSPQLIRWLGSGMVAGMLFFIYMGGLQLHRQLRAARREARHKADFIANVSHELKSPLTTIQLYTEMLESNRVRDEQRKSQYLQTIQKETKRLDRLLDNLLNQNRLERDQLKLHTTSTDIREVIREFSERIQPALQLAKVELFLNLHEPPLLCTADPDAVQQILTNLVDNSLKYAPQGKEITIDAQPGIRGIHISVKDRGPGIGYSFRKQLFVPFERADNTLSTRKPGMGIGLSISRGQAQAMGGDLIYSPRPGGGSVFTLILKPVTPAP